MNPIRRDTGPRYVRSGVVQLVMIKQCRYWQKNIDRDPIRGKFKNKEVGHVDALQSKLHFVPFHVVKMKEEEYVMIQMSMYGDLTRMDSCESRRDSR